MDPILQPRGILRNLLNEQDEVERIPIVEEDVSLDSIQTITIESSDDDDDATIIDEEMEYDDSFYVDHENENTRMHADDEQHSNYYRVDNNQSQLNQFQVDEDNDEQNNDDDYDEGHKFENESEADENEYHDDDNRTIELDSSLDSSSDSFELIGVRTLPQQEKETFNIDDYDDEMPTESVVSNFEQEKVQHLNNENEVSFDGKKFAKLLIENAIEAFEQKVLIEGYSGMEAVMYLANEWNPM